MVTEIIEIRGNLIQLYESFSESLQLAFINTVSHPNAGITHAIKPEFIKRSNLLLQRFYSQIDTQLRFVHETHSDAKLERYVARIKAAMSEDVDAMTNNIRRFTLNVKNAQQTKRISIKQAFTSERERMFTNDDIYRLSRLGKLTQRKL